jgi:hypothetical protein
VARLPHLRDDLHGALHLRSIGKEKHPSRPQLSGGGSGGPWRCGVKEFMGTSINISLVEMESGDYRANAELVVLVSEPTYTVSPAGEMIRQREMGHYRFALTSRAMRSFIKSLVEYADAMEKTEQRFENTTPEVSSQNGVTP